MLVARPPQLTARNSTHGPFVEVEATGPGRITDKLRASEAGERFQILESDAIRLQFLGKARMLDEPTPAGKDYLADLEESQASGRATIEYSQFADAYVRCGPGPDDPDAGPPI